MRGASNRWTAADLATRPLCDIRKTLSTCNIFVNDGCDCSVSSVTNPDKDHLSSDGLYLDTVPAPAPPAEALPSVPQRFFQRFAVLSAPAVARSYPAIRQVARLSG